MRSSPQDACALDYILVPPFNKTTYLSSLVSRLCSCWGVYIYPVWVPRNSALDSPQLHKTVNLNIAKDESPQHHTLQSSCLISSALNEQV